MQPREDPRHALVDRYLAAYEAFDVEGMLATLHPEVAFRNVAGGAVTHATHGRDEFRALAERGVALFRSRRQAVRARGVDGDRVWIDVDFSGVLATGEALRVSGRSTFAFRDGLIVDVVDES
ncbi:nuclear transport factor 2 family protein [Roseisolibacter sp. H3M3-2]|uniref:nuclear transport factor 2 family protein n=1 Tax=Roseisolibacter sp. H3M3-2 TaxID=3031323 RepID=UPI0031F2DC59